MNNFDLIAPVYDRLARVIFLNRILRSQIHFLGEIKPENHVLILGGGTGKILRYIQEGIRIDFVEPSRAMMKKAKNRSTRAQVKFYQMRFEEFDQSKNYDVVICPFFLDLFEDKKLLESVEKVKEFLGDRAKVIVTDFELKRTGRWAALLSKIMHLFFLLFARLESRNLKQIDHTLRQAGFEIYKEHFFYSGFIFSRVYKLLMISLN